MKRLDPILDRVTDWLFPVCSTGVVVLLTWVVTHTDEVAAWVVHL